MTELPGRHHERRFGRSKYGLERIDLRSLQEKNARRFEFVKTSYDGNLAYLLVLNSLVFRVPLAWKRYYAPVCLKLEARIARMQGPRSSCFVVGQWRKR